MADVKISQLPVETSLSGSAVLPIVQGGVTYQAAISTVGTAVLTGSANISTTGTITAGNIGASGTLSGTDITGTSIQAVNNISAGGNVIGSYVNGFNGINTACVQIGQSTVSAFGNITGSYILGNGAYLTGISGGGGGNTGDWTFSANTVSLPFNDYAVISTSGNVVTDTRVTTNYTTADWSYGGSYNLNSAEPVPGTYRLEYVDSGDPTWVATMQAIETGTALTITTAYGTYNATTTGPASSMAPNIIVIPLQVDDGYTFNSSAVTSLSVTTGTLDVANVSGVYTFETDGTFVSDTLLAGNVYIDTNIITPMPIVTVDAYGNETETPQPLVVNGNLSVTGDVYGGTIYGELSALTANTIAIGYQAGVSTQGSLAVAIGNAAGQIIQGANAVAIGSQAGYSTQGAEAVAIGYQAGNISQSSIAVAIGYKAGYANQATYAVAVGGLSASNCQQSQAVAVGFRAGENQQNFQAVAVGYQAAQCAQGTQAIAIGANAGALSGQGSQAIAIGALSGYNNQGSSAIAIGYSAGQNNQGAGAVAVGTQAGGSQQTGAVAVGNYAGGVAGSYSVSLGYGAGASAVATQSIIVNSSGSFLNTSGANTIVLNSKNTLSGYVSQADSFFVNPVREGGNSGSLPSGFYNMAYNPTTKEIIYFT